MNLFAITSLSVAVCCLTLAIFILRIAKTTVHRIWAFFNLAVFSWAMGTFFASISRLPHYAEFGWRWAYGLGPFVPLIFYHFIYSFCELKKPKTLRVVYAIGILFIPINFFVPNFIKELNYVFNSFYYHKATILFTIFMFYLGTVVFMSFNEILRYLRTVKGNKRLQATYILFGFGIGWTGGITTFLPPYNILIYPSWNFLISIYTLLMTYAIFRYQIVDIKIAVTRSGIFAAVYLFVLGIPFWLGYKYNLWQYSTWAMLFLATAGPFIYAYLRRKAEARILVEEYRARQLLARASEGMLRYRNIKELVDLIVHVTTKMLKLENAALFLFDEKLNQYKLVSLRLKSKYNYLDSLDIDDFLIQKLSKAEKPLVYEEVKMQAQQLRDKPNNQIQEIEQQMQKLASAVVVPAISRGNLLGFVSLGEKKSKRMYSNEDLNLLWVLSNQVALAIENAKFHKKAQEELLKEDRELTARFIGHGASHQFGNVLNRIIQRSSGKEMDIEEIDFNKLSAEDLRKIILNLKEELHAITTVGMQGKDIVSGILSLGTGSPVEFKKEDLRQIINRAVVTIKLKQSKQLVQNMDTITDIVINTPDNLPFIWCNSLQIEQVLDNMLDNALEAIEEKENLIKAGELQEDGVFRGRIVIDVNTNLNSIYLTLSDNGIGIKQEDSKKIFIAFFTTKATERLSRKGHGIGMNMVKEIIAAHQGKIAIENTEYGKGTTFKIELPVEIENNKKIP